MSSALLSLFYNFSKYPSFHSFLKPTTPARFALGGIPVPMQGSNLKLQFQFVSVMILFLYYFMINYITDIIIIIIAIMSMSAGSRRKWNLPRPRKYLISQSALP